MAVARILIIEDEPAIADSLAFSLGREGYVPVCAHSGTDGLAHVESGGFALVILDVGLPDLSGFEVCRRIRAIAAELPVMFLTAHSEEIDRVLGFEIGADDYVAKPFSLREVLARVRVILRRNNGGAAAGEVQAPDGFVLNEVAASIRYRDTVLALTRFEYLLLRWFLLHPGQVFSRDQLLDAVWGMDRDSTDRTVDTHIKTLRAKLRACAPEADPIVTHRGLGYSLQP